MSACKHVPASLDFSILHEFSPVLQIAQLFSISVDLISCADFASFSDSQARFARGYAPPLARPGGRVQSHTSQTSARVSLLRIEIENATSQGKF